MIRFITTCIRFCLVMAAALALQENCATAEPPAGFQPLFSGKDLSGWEGREDVWKVEDGVIVGDTPGLANNEFLATTRSFQDFVLTVRFRLVGGRGNSGIQFRSARIPNHHEMIGYQADVGQQYWGCLYDESRRRRVLVEPPPELQEVLKKDGWNEYWLRCMNNRIEILLNGLKVVDYTEEEADIPQSGLIALQVHSSKEPIRVEFTDIYIQELPVAKSVAKDATGFLLRTHKFADGSERKYTMFLPKDYHARADLKWPLIAFLHGSGERGIDGQLSAKVGIGPAVLARADSFPFIVLMPQAEESWLADTPDAASAMELLDVVQKEYRIDANRIHLTGLSMGGKGAWSIAQSHPRRWASLSVLCGKHDAKSVSKLAHLPIWGFCGVDDKSQTVESMRTTIAAIRDAGGNVKYTEYPGIGHNCWDLTYNTEALFSWMMSATRPSRR